MGETRLLIVSDDQAAQGLLGQLCRTRGFDLSHAETVSLVHKYIAKGLMDLIVLDLDNHDIDGVRLLKALAAGRLSAPVVLMSHCDDRTLHAAQQVGIQHGLHMGRPLLKPLDESASVRSILDALEIHDPAITATDIREAIHGDQLRLHYQPLVDVKNGHVRNVEALLRWEHPDYGHLNPELVVSLAEKNGLIGLLTDWVLTTSLKACAEWRRQGWDFRVAVNITPGSLFQLDFADRVVNILNTVGVPPESLIVEITEGQAITEQLDVLETLARLRLARVSLAIDDFGTGYSSLGRLHSLPFTELKIDKSFVMDTPGDPRLEMVVRAIADLGKNLGLTVVAEGVATREAWDLVESMGCDIAQGYFISRPLPADMLTEWLYRWDVPTTVGTSKPGEAATPAQHRKKRNPGSPVATTSPTRVPARDG
ncbi:MAG: EAL domain-containing response regulator [Planctomycetota bacterium]|jgi:EAL domain-containing protein (putative c-di-GMP-specific phosphodiesterase class I)|nr:EAL domain-containing response regulator [Planctomycetota bacterium]